MRDDVERFQISSFLAAGPYSPDKPDQVPVPLYQPIELVDARQD